jgi:agmatine deiminase
MMTRRKFTAVSLAGGIMGGMTGLAIPKPSWAKAPLINPAAMGFRAPEESSPHERTFMQWPSSIEVYKYAEDLQAVQEKIALIADTIAGFEPVVLLADGSLHDEIREWISSANIELWDIATEDLWCRDAGPVFLKNTNNELAAVNLNFNGWGNKQLHVNDGRIADLVTNRMGVPIFDNGVVGESGGVEFDGVGTLIAHDRSWINPHRNAGSREEISALLQQAYGASKTIWAKGVYGQDITDYHIDALARFTEPGVVLIQLPDKIDRSDPWSSAAYETYEALKKATDHEGNKFEIVVIPEPVDIRSDSREFVASYVNYYVCNGAVISAEFGDDEADGIAAETLAELYPGRKIVSLNVDAIGEAGGGIHCATQQQPASTGIWQP